MVAKKRLLLGITALVLIGALLGFLLHSRSTGPARLKLAVVTWVGFGPFYVAQDKGFFREQGIDVELLRIDDFGARRAALASGKLDGSVETIDSLAIGLAQGIPAVEVLLVDESYGGDGIVATRDIKSLADLSGKTVALAKTTPSHFFLLYLMDQASLNPATITIKPMDAGDAGAAFVAGKVDAAVTWEPWLGKAKDTPRGHILTTSREHPGIIADCFVVHPDLARNRPEAVKALLRAWFKAIDFLKSDGPEAIAIISKRLELPAADLEGMLQGVRFPSYEDNMRFMGVGGGDNRMEQMFSAALRLWQKEGVIAADKKIAPASVYNPAFLRDMNK